MRQYRPMSKKEETIPNPQRAVYQMPIKTGGFVSKLLQAAPQKAGSDGTRGDSRPQTAKNGQYRSFKCSHTLSFTGENSPNKGMGRQAYKACNPIPRRTVPIQPIQQSRFIKSLLRISLFTGSRNHTGTRDRIYLGMGVRNYVPLPSAQTIVPGWPVNEDSTSMAKPNRCASSTERS